MVRVLASHRCDPGLNPGINAFCGLSLFVLPFAPKGFSLGTPLFPGGGGNSHTLPIRVCAAQRGRDFEAPDLERGTHFRGVF